MLRKRKKQMVAEDNKDERFGKYYDCLGVDV
jgi:hypothetical protein